MTGIARAQFFACVFSLLSCTQVKQPTTPNRPIHADSLQEYPVEIFADGDCTCALSNGSKVACWGNCFIDGESRGAIVVAAGVKKKLLLKSSHFCWLNLADDRIRCDLVENGQSSSRPKEVPGTDDVETQVSVEKIISPGGIWSDQFNRFCALDSRKGFLCWKPRNEHREDSFLEFSEFTNLEPGFHAKQIFLGRFHNCALSTLGRAYCWGANGSGQCSKGRSAEERRPSHVEGLSNIADMALGQYHSCALIEGAIYCWGDLGFIRAQQEKTTHIPEQMSGPEDFLKIISGESYLCGLREIGSVECWFDSSGGSPRSVVVEGLVSNVIGLAGGNEHACALMENRQIACWGENSVGQVGRAPTAGRVGWNSSSVVAIDWKPRR